MLAFGLHAMKPEVAAAQFDLIKLLQPVPTRIVHAHCHAAIDAR